MPVRQIGKIGRQWAKFRKEYIKLHPPNFDGFYECYICGVWILPEAITLDHIQSRSRRPDLRFNEDNIAFCCFPCNSSKGSKSLENISKTID